ncbi:MAG: UDP-GlcNAc--UDP-phosphate GlcNAc-1-phosphate transferase [Bacteroidetes bacterium]|nr:UDP-GlcNAc--UDP-phosphate GlcNAc-1-phosphate transferase [Bacteroidota bacterium]
MITYIIILVCLFVCAYLYLKIAERFNIVDNPNFRSSHTVPVIRGGGILFYLSILLFFILSDFPYPYFFIGLTLVAVISFLDDIFTLTAKQRLPIHLLSVLLVLWELGVIPDTPILAVILIIIGIVFINTFNFMDGINGITGFYSAVVLALLLFVSYRSGFLEIDIFIYALLAIIVFGFYNFRKKARFFSGDIGSLTMALLLFFCGTYLSVNLNAPIIILAVAVYGADSLLTIFYRLSLKENIAQPHRRHIYQKLVDRLSLPHLAVAGIYALLQLVIGILVISYYQSEISFQWILIIGVLLLLSILYFVAFNYLEKSI